MMLINPSTGEMECRVCGCIHYANQRPGYLGGGYYCGSWQCSWEQCPSNVKVWSTEANRWVRIDWRKETQPAAVAL
jgi:hypothetical protein